MRLPSPAHKEISKQVKQSASVHVDETGWWVAAESHWAWVAATANCTLYVIARSRGHEVAEAMIGKEYQGCLHSDFLNTYSPLACKKAKCLSTHYVVLDARERDLQRLQEVVLTRGQVPVVVDVEQPLEGQQLP